MKVRAIGPGQYDNDMKNRGDVFEIKDEVFTPVWMEKYVEPKADTVVEPKAEESAPEGQ